MRDVLDDDERKLKPISVLLFTTAAILSSMIVYNGLTVGATDKASSLASSQASTRMQIPAPQTSSNTVVFKYDATVEDVQRELLATGHYIGMVDGVMGQRTGQAVQRYQQENGLTVTGDVSQDLVNHIRYTRKIKAAAEFTGSIAPSTAELPKPVTPLKIKQLTASAPGKPNQRKVIMQVQMTLANLGYDLGEPSGEMDDATHTAILQYEMDNGLNMAGIVDATLVTALGKTVPKKISINN